MQLNMQYQANLFLIALIGKLNDLDSSVSLTQEIDGRWKGCQQRVLDSAC